MRGNSRAHSASAQDNSFLNVWIHERPSEVGMDNRTGYKMTNRAVKQPFGNRGAS
jgi:hypothetical protein